MFPTFLRSDPKCRMYQNGMVLGCGGTGLVPGTFRGVQGSSGSDLGLRHPGVCEWSWMNVEMKLGVFRPGLSTFSLIDTDVYSMCPPRVVSSGLEGS